jgi:hypothetical protein
MIRRWPTVGQGLADSWSSDRSGPERPPMSHAEVGARVAPDRGHEAAGGDPGRWVRGPARRVGAEVGAGRSHVDRSAQLSSFAAAPLPGSHRILLHPPSSDHRLDRSSQGGGVMRSCRCSTKVFTLGDKCRLLGHTTWPAWAERSSRQERARIAERVDPARSRTREEGRCPDQRPPPREGRPCR